MDYFAYYDDMKKNDLLFSCYLEKQETIWIWNFIDDCDKFIKK